MDYKEFLEKYNPDCDFYISHARGYGGYTFLKVSYLNYSEQSYIYEEGDISAELDRLCSELDASIRAYKIRW